ncbi:MAG: metal ABC transporter substrate-binding protein [Moraxella sp.]|uniref:metal ABC transporter substrate-binding protein n=1 Tax=Moraxella sp. TaxID=479 RepID=UPI0026DB77BE|nr:metal ABC transporter substrate-binding protein [Moraxella sp.]MDO4450935.1 metal ABC transporter substrate-binding protein [Moraxella sp.]
MKLVMRRLMKLLALGFFGVGVAHAGMVTVSNYPLLLLSNAVTEGAEPAQVLLSAGDVGHHGSLSPSKVKLVGESDYVVWFGHELEQNLVKTLDTAPNAISLFKMKAFYRLPLRNLDGTARPDTFDPHIWLDPNNAKAIVRALAVIHTHANPTKKELYHANAKKFAKRMDKAVSDVVKPREMPYWAYHDSFAYLERSANLKFAGALTPDHHLSPKASQFRTLNATRPSAHMCLISQGEVSDGIKSKLGNVHTLVKQEDMSDGADYVEVWQATVKGIYACIDGQ